MTTETVNPEVVGQLTGQWVRTFYTRDRKRLYGNLARVVAWDVAERAAIVETSAGAYLQISIDRLEKAGVTA